MSAGLAVFDTTVQETQAWLNLAQTRMRPCDRQATYAATRAVLHVLRDRLPTAMVLALSAQMPMLMRGFFLEGWRIQDAPSDLRTPEAFERAVAQALPPAFPREASAAVAGVFAMLSQRLDPGLADKIAHHLPEPLREVWRDAVAA